MIIKCCTIKVKVHLFHWLILKHFQLLGRILQCTHIYTNTLIIEQLPKLTQNNYRAITQANTGQMQSIAREQLTDHHYHSIDQFHANFKRLLKGLQKIQRNPNSDYSWPLNRLCIKMEFADKKCTFFLPILYFILSFLNACSEYLTLPFLLFCSHAIVFLFCVTYTQSQGIVF